MGINISYPLKVRTIHTIWLYMTTNVKLELLSATFGLWSLTVSNVNECLHALLCQWAVSCTRQMTVSVRSTKDTVKTREMLDEYQIHTHQSKGKQSKSCKSAKPRTNNSLDHWIETLAPGVNDGYGYVKSRTLSVLFRVCCNTEHVVYSSFPIIGGGGGGGNDVTTAANYF